MSPPDKAGERIKRTNEPKQLGVTRPLAHHGVCEKLRVTAVIDASFSSFDQHVGPQAGK